MCKDGTATTNADFLNSAHRCRNWCVLVCMRAGTLGVPCCALVSRARALAPALPRASLPSRQAANPYFLLFLSPPPPLPLSLSPPLPASHSHSLSRSLIPPFPLCLHGPSLPSPP
eukprot:5004245-Pleurochrysis_carterae.AAC.1